MNCSLKSLSPVVLNRPQSSFKYTPCVRLCCASDGLPRVAQGKCRDPELLPVCEYVLIVRRGIQMLADSESICVSANTVSGIFSSHQSAQEPSASGTLPLDHQRGAHKMSRNQECIGNDLKYYGPILSTETVQAESQEDLSSILREIQANFGPEFGILFKCQLSYWNHMSDRNQDLWLKSTSSVPRLLNGSHCWRGRAPLARELFMDTIKEISTENSRTQKSSGLDFGLISG